MKNYVCKKCGSMDVFIKPNGTNAIGLYCGDCGKWIKWVSKSELPLVERFIEEQKNDIPVTYSDNTQMMAENTKEMQTLEVICRTVSDYLKQNYGPHTTVIITDSQIRLTRDEIGIPVER